MSEGISIINKVVEILGKEGIPPTDSAIVAKLRTINLINETDTEIKQLRVWKAHAIREMLWQLDEMFPFELQNKYRHFIKEYADKLEDGLK